MRLAHRLIALLMIRDPLSESVHLTKAGAASAGGARCGGHARGAARWTPGLLRGQVRSDETRIGRVKTPDAVAAPPSSQRSSFYLAMRILAPEQRQAMYEVYAFCRAVDDIADDGGPSAGRIAMLDRWRRDLAQLYAGRRTTAADQGARRPDQNFRSAAGGFPRHHRRHGDGRASRYPRPDWEALDLYCDRVASAVGRLSVKIFGIEEEKGRLLSHHLGRALQMTNILRDLDQDAELGRLYLPKEMLADAGIADTGHRQGAGASAPRRRLRRRRRPRATAFRRGVGGDGALRRQSVRSPRIMASVYRALLERLVSARLDRAASKGAARRSLQFLWAVMRYGVV